MPEPINLHSRLNLACEQLDVAIELFFSNRSDVSALTLAGAAEEITGRAITAKGGEYALRLRHEERKKLMKRAKRAYVKTFQTFADENNYARNAAKHMTPGKKTQSGVPEDAYFRADPRAEAVRMILRAMQNLDNLGITLSDRRREFYGWYMSTIYTQD